MFKPGLSVFYVLLFLTGGSCVHHEQETDEPAQPTQTPVTVTSIRQEPLAEYVELIASSTYLLKNYVKANATGYLRSAQVVPGQFVHAGQVLFSIKTKEAESLGNIVNGLDSSFKFSGTNAIRAGADGFVSQINHQSGDYVQDGEQLAVISELQSFGFIMELPYELRSFVKVGDRLDIQMPDGEKIPGRISSLMPTVESVSQTQNVLIKVNATHTIPENLIAKIRIPKIIREHAISLPRAAVLTDETQTDFWVMKMTDSTTAVKIPIKKGMETKERIEILSPVFSSQDRILTSGNYGLPDTAKVRINQP